MKLDGTGGSPGLSFPASVHHPGVGYHSPDWAGCAICNAGKRTDAAEDPVEAAKRRSDARNASAYVPVGSTEATAPAAKPTTTRADAEGDRVEAAKRRAAERRANAYKPAGA
jgi:hypothetical protein